VEWKKQKGIPTTIINVSEIGNSSSKIMNYIQDFYDGSDLAWVLLVGDAAEVATPSSFGGASDPSYSKVSGGDDYPDIFVGRFSAENINHVQTQVQRSVEYEISPQLADWYHRATGIASDEGPGHYNEYDDEHMALIRLDLLSYNYDLVDEIYDPGATASQVTNALNNGRGFVNYCGHGSSVSWGTTGFSNSNINSLVNDNMLPFIISVACVNGEFNYGTCFAEAWLRATNGGNPTGAVATYMSSINQSWSPPMYAQDEAVDLLTAESSVTFGGICFNGSCLMIDVVGYGGVEMFDTWHIFGDPSLQLFTDTPSSMTVNHPGTIPPLGTQYDVDVPGIEGALCALYFDGVLYGSAYTSSSGSVTIEITESLPYGETLILTVTALNRFPFFGAVHVMEPSGPFVVYNSYTVDDALGNNNGSPDAGESLILGLQLDNIGPEDASGVTAVISSTDPYVIIGDDSEYFGSIPGNGTGYIADAYSLDIAPETPDAHEIHFELAISCDPDHSWNDGFSMPVSAPVLEYADLIIDDAAGNGDGILDPGETAEFIVVLTNGGSVTAASVSGILSTDDGLISITDPDGFFGDIEPAGNGDNSGDVFIVTVDESYPVGQFATFDLALEGDLGYTTDVQFGVLVGLMGIPTLSEWGIAVLSLLLLALGTAATIKKRKTQYHREKARAA
jgi:hypothetical protein